MHGVRKEELPEEEKAAKKLEQQKKLQAFQKGRDYVLNKHKKGQFDYEGLEASGKLLGANPDVSTFWNYRRRALEYFMALEKKKEALQEEQSPFISDKTFKLPETGGDKVKPDSEKKKIPEPKSIDDCEVEKLFHAELDLTFTCILKNPKSYGSWHQRGWVLSRMKRPDFAHEIKTCNKALEMDERNFHCWDHRRLICKLAGISEKEELAFVDEKVTANFSNYSAWHYRASLLKRLHPDPEGNLPLEGELLEKELELAANAFYTDPDDTSAWFYTTWLFQEKSRSREEAKLIGADFSGKDTRLILLFSSPISVDRLSKLTVWHNNVNVSYIPRAVRASELVSTAGTSGVWMLRLDPGHEDSERMDSVEILFEGATSEVGRGKHFHTLEIMSRMVRAPQPTGPVKNALETQLGHCRELIKLEPENKWALFTATQCLQRLGACATSEEVANDEISTNFDQLSRLDPKRKSFYPDMRSRHIMERKMTAWLHSTHEKQGQLIVANSRLTTLYFANIFAVGIRSLNIENNAITSLRPLKLCLNLRSLSAGGNKLENLDGLQYLKDSLEEVFVPGNRIVSAQSGICQYLTSAERLTKLMVAENPFRQSEEESGHLANFFNDGVRIIMDWL